MTIKQGDIVCIRTTGEYVYFTGKQYDNGAWEVHRPVLSRDGINHQYDSFEIAELETIEQHVEREVKEAFMKLDAQKRVMNAKVEALEASEAKIDFSLN
jgi:hypothetical protein